ncbi:hypothetical protein DL765_008766 [Monosporascus sp. GIB2]|nr:hypothetical protein DL765_008766 [Monosporascus sp. GIB2]
MHLTTRISALLAVIAGVSALPPPDLTSESAPGVLTTDAIHAPREANSNPYEGDALMSYFLNFNDATLQTNIPMSTLYRGDEIIPFEELPPCYQECFRTNCCNMAPDGAPDVRQMTVDDFCYNKAVAVHEWMLDHAEYGVESHVSS